MSGDRGWYPASTPRRVDGGIKAKSSRGSIGSSWWSRRFLDVLESLAMGGRLSRGKTYARKGQVLELEIAPGEVRARVQGSRRTPYDVAIGFAVLPEHVWAEVEIALSEAALPSAHLLAGEVPPELEDVFAEAGAALFPTAANDLAQSCSCPDWGVPCKHVAATFYLLAEAFDDDPFLLLQWRGRDREALLARLRALRSDDVSEADGAPESPALGVGLAVADTHWPGATVDRFWQPPPPLPEQPAVLDTDPGLLLRQLPVPAPGLGGERLVERLRTAYARFEES